MVFLDYVVYTTESIPTHNHFHASLHNNQATDDDEMGRRRREQTNNFLFSHFSSRGDKKYMFFSSIFLFPFCAIKKGSSSFLPKYNITCTYYIYK